ncbi:MAG: thioredoxin [Deltaproteobacteria bacterium]|nr:MAG: thioredoxin [Deltaproteobacteria bacterium]
MLGRGQKAPDFELTAPDGTAVRLSAVLAEGPALLIFAEADCPTSRMALARVEPARRRLESAGVRVLVVHQDPPERIRATLERTGSGAASVSEPPPFAVAEAYGVATLPSAFAIGSDGRIATSIEGWSHEDYVRAFEWLAAQQGTVPPQLDAEPPLVKPGCAAKNTLDPELVRAAAEAADEFEELFARGWTDGLPVVPPTRARVERMLGGRDPAESLGRVPPGMGELTLERLAACAVLAGCHPSYFPVVIAGARAMLAPEFNLHGMTNTTHTAGAVVIVNGPIRRRIGMNAGMNAMGGWNRANATIGRALRLMVGLTGSGRPGVLDRSTLGQPGKISFCFAENEEESPWSPLSVDRGFREGEDVVTVYCGDAPFSVSDHYSRTAEDIARSLGLAGGAVFSPHFYPVGAETVFVISPEHARSLAEAGWSKQEVAERIFDASKKRVAELAGGEQGPFTAGLDPETELAKWTDLSQIVIVVAGGSAGRFSAVLPPWVGFGLGSTMVSVPIVS